MYFDAFTYSGLAVGFAILIALVFILHRSNREARRQIRRLAEHTLLMHEDNSVRRLCRALADIRPGVCPAVDFTVEPGQGGGPAYLADWFADPPRPSDAQIAEALEKLAREYRHLDEGQGNVPEPKT
jgi:hypothetical protein